MMMRTSVCAAMVLVEGVRGFVHSSTNLRGRESVAVNMDAAGVAIASVPVLGVGALLLSGDGGKVVDDKKEVESYFNGVGFGRWNNIYSESDEVNGVQMDIRTGHQQTIDRVLDWTEDTPTSWCDLGCGVGSLAIPIAQKGGKVYASDISAAMTEETAKRAQNLGVQLESVETSDMENVKGEYDTVSCIDVMIHYPTDTMVGLVDKLTQLGQKRIFVSFAPNTLQYSLLKKIGSLFPGPSKTTRAYLHKEADVEQALNDRGFVVKRRHLTATNFYFSLLFEAVPASSSS